MSTYNLPDICWSIQSKFDSKRAFIAQKVLSKKILKEDHVRRIQIIGGLDLSYTNNKSIGIAVLSIVDYRSLKLIKCFYATTYTCIPYIPGLLAFREMPPIALLLTWAKKRKLLPDVLIVDGHGIAHPRGFGIASHVGVVFDVPSIGVAKRRLTGIEDDNKVVDKKTGEIIAYILYKGNRKIYVSIGHKVSLETAVNIVRRTWTRGRIPVPTLLADRFSKQLKHIVSSRDLGTVRECHRLGLY
ncbi:MAG: endonuclease V [Desulfurococcales archaeon]|nr:endonuclease V [Desulfurococcales archaeon]